MYKFLRPLLFQLDPESAHALSLQALRLASSSSPGCWLLKSLFLIPSKPVKAFGLTFPNAVGLAAGYDKDGIAIAGLSALGLGHLEIGTVTTRPQRGNPKPRIFRLVEDEAVINRMGFPGKGAEFVRYQLLAFRKAKETVKKSQNAVVIGVNLGKNKDTPLEEAARDYTALMQIFAPLADYLTINISSPNTVGLRRLQGREMLENLLGEIKRARSSQNWSTPMLVKLAPDLNGDELADAVAAIVDSGMDGIIATNTTLARAELRAAHRDESGGLSGSPLRLLSETVLQKTLRLVNGAVPIISVGGIMTPDDAKRRLDLGAALVQVYTGLVYRGPGFIKNILREIGK